MIDELLPYYEHELQFIRDLGAEFGKTYPKIANRLQLEPDKCEDPHVERLIQAFALLAGRVQHKIDDEFPEITEALLGVLYPHYLRPIPSMSIAQFELDPQKGKISGAYRLERNTPLYTRPIAGSGSFCTFRTCYPVVSWPVEVTAASIAPPAHLALTGETAGIAAGIRIQMKCTGGAKLSSLEGLDKFRFYLNASGEVAHTLHELLFNNTARVLLRDPSRRRIETTLPAGCIREVGFARDEDILTYPDRSFAGYRLLQEYFSFPRKFLFFDLCGFDRIEREPFGDSFEILILLNEFERKSRLQHLEQNVKAETFQLGCTPIVNLFTRSAEPIRLSHAQTEYRIVADVHRQPTTEIYSVDSVASATPYLEQTREYEPFYSLRHAYSGEPANAYWYASRQRSQIKGDDGTEVYLSLVDLEFQTSNPPGETLTIHVTCTNRDLPGDLPISMEFGELSTDAASSLRVRCLTKPTRTVRPPVRRGLQWRLISHLSLNYLSIAEHGRDALQEILKLYDFSEDPVIRAQIAGVTDISSRPEMARVTSAAGVVFGLGMGVRMEFDEDAFVGAGVFLFASVLERFLGLYSSINSFSRLTATTRQRKGVLKQWPPRAGEQILL